MDTKIDFEDQFYYDQYPCKHRAEDGACAVCAWMAPCWFPENCKCREEN